MAPPQALPLSTLTAKSWTKAQTVKEFKRYWEDNIPSSYKALGIDLQDGCPKELSLARPIAGQIYAARSGHGDFAIYHERFNHTNAHLFCSCGELKSSRHLLQCRKPLIKLPKTPKSCRDAARYFLGTNAGAVKLAKWLSDTKYFAEICPRNLL